MLTFVRLLRFWLYFLFSCCIATTETAVLRDDMNPEEKLRAVFDPIVKPDMRESWEKQWKSWFCTTNEVEDIRFPGKLKGLLIKIRLFYFLQRSSVFNEVNMLVFVRKPTWRTMLMINRQSLELKEYHIMSTCHLTLFCLNSTITVTIK